VGTLARGPYSISGESKLLSLVYATASLRSGLLLDADIEPGSRERLEGLAATLPELFGRVDAGCLDRISERLGEQGAGQVFAEMLLLSDEHLHLIQPLATRPGVALLAVTSTALSTGLALSEFHARVAAIEGK
jgi:hypothetical protein